MGTSFITMAQRDLEWGTNNRGKTHQPSPCQEDSRKSGNWSKKDNSWVSYEGKLQKWKKEGISILQVELKLCISSLHWMKSLRKQYKKKRGLYPASLAKERSGTIRLPRKEPKQHIKDDNQRHEQTILSYIPPVPPTWIPAGDKAPNLEGSHECSLAAKISIKPMPQRYSL